MSRPQFIQSRYAAAPPAPTSLREGTVSGPHLDGKRRKLGHLIDLP